MGYDLSWVNLPGSQRPAGDYAAGIYVGGGVMEMIREAMFEFGMLCDWDEPPMPSPSVSELDGTLRVRDDCDSPVDEPASLDHGWSKDELEIYDGDRGDVIPSYKLATNDGWLVTPAEVNRALSAYDRHPDGRDPGATKCLRKGPDGTTPEPECWSDWLEFLRGAADHGGFRVH